MPTVIILALFSLVFTLIAGIVSHSTSNVAVLNKQRIGETYTFFENIAQVATQDINNSYYHANPKNAKTIVEYIKGLSEMKRLSTGRMTDPTLDAWGQTVEGKIYTEYQPLSSSTDTLNHVMVPVTAVALVSSGPDRILQTSIPGNITNMSQINGIIAPSGSDDIVYHFDNRNSQQLLLDTIKLHLNRIGTATLKEIQSKLTDYRRAKMTIYQDLISQGKDVSLTSVVDIAKDPSAPHIAPLDGTSIQGKKHRRDIGVDQDFALLEAPLGGGGKFVVSSTLTNNPADPFQIILTNFNEDTKKTPWGDPSTPNKPLRYQITIQAVSSTLGI